MCVCRNKTSHATLTEGATGEKKVDQHNAEKNIVV